MNAEGSVDLVFGPAAPASTENNWVQTIPSEAWFNKTWRPGEIEPL